MQSWSCRRTPRRRSWFCSGAIVAAAFALAGCNTSGQQTASLSAPRGSVAFETIDGPPKPLFNRLVASLNDEAQARQLPVVSRDSGAAYRVRGYLAAHSTKSNVAVTWLWDVYDADKNRALRISGSQTIAGKHRNAWEAIDDATLHHIAQASVDELARFLISPEAPAQEMPATTIFASNSTPEGAGIFRIAASESAAVVEATDGEDTAPQSGPIPLPRYRPKTAATTGPALTVAVAPR